MKTVGRPTELEPLDATLREPHLREPHLRGVNARLSSRAQTTARVRRIPLKIADEYLLRHMVSATGRGVLWFAGLLFMYTFITAVQRIASGSLDWAGAWDLVMSDVPHVFVFTLPMSLLYGTVQTFAELSSKGEATALQVGGMSLGRMMRAPLLWGALVGLCVFVLQDRFVPATQQLKQNIIAQSNLKTALPKTDVRLSDPFDGKGELKSIIQAKKLDFKAGTMEQPRIQLFNSEQRMYRQISAPLARWNPRLGKWDLTRAVTTDISADSQKVTISPPHSIEYSMPSPGALGLKTMSFAQHLDNGEYDMASISDLRDHRTQLQNSLRGQDPATQRTTQRLINNMTYGMHDKIATAFTCIFLVLIGAPLALRPQRSGGGFAMGISLVVLMGYYILWTWAQTMGGAGEVNPLVFGYLPMSVTALVGLIMFWKKAR